MQQVWKFYCGLTKFHENSKFEALLNCTDYDSMYKIQCCFESQQSHVCDTIVENNSLSFTNMFLSPSNFSEIAYIISHTSKNHVYWLKFERCTFAKEGVDVLVSKAGYL